MLGASETIRCGALGSVTSRPIPSVIICLDSDARSTCDPGPPHPPIRIRQATISTPIGADERALLTLPIKGGREILPADLDCRFTAGGQMCMLDAWDSGKEEEGESRQEEGGDSRRENLVRASQGGPTSSYAIQADSPSSFIRRVVERTRGRSPDFAGVLARRRLLASLRCGAKQWLGRLPFCCSSWRYSGGDRAGFSPASLFSRDCRVAGTSHL